MTGKSWSWVAETEKYSSPLPCHPHGVGLIECCTHYGVPIPSRRRRYIHRSVRKEVYKRDGHVCQDCGNKRQLSLDHVVPFSQGGSDESSNLQTLCRPCNSRKGVQI